MIEECLVGEEVSFFALCDGDDRPAAGRGAGPQAGRRRRYRPEHRRHGRLFARRRSSPRTLQRARSWPRIIRPALAEMARRGTPFRGVLFAGLMLTADGPKLIEFNVRFGDPECQALMLRLRSDLLAGAAGRLRRRAGGLRPALGSAAEPGRGDGGATAIPGAYAQGAPRSAASTARRRCPACRSSMPARCGGRTARCWPMAAGCCGIAATGASAAGGARRGLCRGGCARLAGGILPAGHRPPGAVASVGRVSARQAGPDSSKRRCFGYCRSASIRHART